MNGNDKTGGKSWVAEEQITNFIGSKITYGKRTNKKEKEIA